MFEEEDAEAGCRMMAKCCACGAFNPARAEELLFRMQERGFLHSPRGFSTLETAPKGR